MKVVVKPEVNPSRTSVNSVTQTLIFFSNSSKRVIKVRVWDIYPTPAPYLNTWILRFLISFEEKETYDSQKRNVSSFELPHG